MHIKAQTSHHYHHFLPFLYYTRTLAPLFSKRRRTPNKFYSTSDVQPPPPSLKITRSTESPYFREKKRAYAEEVASYPSYGEWQKTKEPYKDLKTSRTSHNISTSFSRTNIDQFVPGAEPFEEDEDGENELNDEEDPSNYGERQVYDLDSYRPGAPPKESTITDSERQAFNRIFSDILKGLKTKGHTKLEGSMGHNTGEARTETTSLMSDAVTEWATRDATKKDRSGRPTVSFKFLTEDPLSVQEKMQVEIEKYPASLRPAASKALASVARRDIFEPAVSSMESRTQLEEVNSLEHLRNPERKRVEQLMRDAKDDFELWQILETEVFSIISDLGLEEKEEDIALKSTRRDKSKKKNKTRKDGQDTTTFPNDIDNKNIASESLIGQENQNATTDTVLETRESINSTSQQDIHEQFKQEPVTFESTSVKGSEVGNIPADIDLELKQQNSVTSEPITEKVNQDTTSNPESEKQEPAVTTSSSSETSDITPLKSLEVFGPLYPSYLLLALRLLSASFTHSSPLTLCILPRIKSLGMISQVLGASTALYNELLRIQWLRYDNYASVLSLLSEMENSGLDFDRETLDVVQGVVLRSRNNRNEVDRGLQLLFETKYRPYARLFAKWERKIRTEVEGREREFERGLVVGKGERVGDV